MCDMPNSYQGAPCFIQFNVTTSSHILCLFVDFYVNILCPVETLCVIN